MSEENGAVEGGGPGEAAEALAQAVYFENDYSGAAERYEHAFAAYRRASDALGAARCARMLAWIHGNVFGDWAVQNGWRRRARTELSRAAEDSAERGWIELLAAHTEAELGTQVTGYRRALELGRTHGDPNLEYEALAWLGVTEVMLGRLEGLAILDEALTAICAGEVDDIYVIEGSFCGMLWACEMAHDVGRARQWMRALEDLRLRRSLPAMASFCRAHYGSILTAAGRWDEAERELVHAARPFEDTETRMKTSALVRLAQLRVLQGRYEEAEQLLEGLDPQAEALYPKAALLLSQGRSELARDAIDRALSGPIDTSVDGPLLVLLAEAALAAGDVDDACRAADRLDALAEANGGSYMNAAAALARGSVDLATGSPDARAHLEEALRGFAEAEMPLEIARARLVLARCLATERPEVAVAEAKTALDAFDRLQAARYADEAAALLRSLGAPVRVGPKGKEALTKREAEVLKLLGHGLSNPEISDRLYISRKTVEHHVGNVLAKLGLRSRAEAAAYATRSQIEKTSS